MLSTCLASLGTPKKRKKTTSFFTESKEFPHSEEKKKRIFREEYTMAAVHCINDLAFLANDENSNGKYRVSTTDCFFLFFSYSLLVFVVATAFKFLFG